MTLEPHAYGIPTLLLTGFLGSGKTTLLNGLLRAPGMRDTAVLVNEFGEIGIDHLLVESLDDEVVLLNAGCLCCTIRGDIVARLSDLHERRAQGLIPKFRRVVIETTGLADPAPILHTLLSHETVRGRYGVESVLATVDAVNGDRHLTEHGESVKQVAVADRLLVTKADIGERPSIDALRARLGVINPGAPILEVIDGNVDPHRLLGDTCDESGMVGLGSARWLGAMTGAHMENGVDTHGHARHDDRIQQLSIEAIGAIEAHKLVAWIERLLVTHGDKVLRVKGIFDLAGSEVPVVVHGVQHVFHPLARLARWPDGERRSRIVIIAKDLAMGAVEDDFCRSVLAPRR